MYSFLVIRLWMWNMSRRSRILVLKKKKVLYKCNLEINKDLKSGRYVFRRLRSVCCSLYHKAAPLESCNPWENRVRLSSSVHSRFQRTYDLSETWPNISVAAFIPPSCFRCRFRPQMLLELVILPFIVVVRSPKVGGFCIFEPDFVAHVEILSNGRWTKLRFWIDNSSF